MDLPENGFSREELEELRRGNPRMVKRFVALTERLFLSQINRIFGPGQRFSLDEDAKLALLADCLSHVYSKLSRFDPERNTKLTTWAAKVCENKLRDVCRKHERSLDPGALSLDKLSADTDNGFYGSDLRAGPEFDPERLFAGKEHWEGFRRSLAEIEADTPAYHQDVELLRAGLAVVVRDGEFSQRAIAPLIGVSPSTVCRNMRKWAENGFLDRLKEVMTKNGVWQ